MSCVDTTITNTNQVPSAIVEYKEPTIETEARDLVDGARNDECSHPAENFSRIAKMWSAILDTEVSPNQVAMCMVALKLARECHKHKRDHLVDAIGYIIALDKVVAEQPA